MWNRCSVWIERKVGWPIRIAKGRLINEADNVEIEREKTKINKEMRNWKREKEPDPKSFVRWFNISKIDSDMQMHAYISLFILNYNCQIFHKATSLSTQNMNKS